MLYWGIFTVGYILGVVFTLTLFIKKEEGNVGKNRQSLEKVVMDYSSDSMTNYDNLTKINYTSQSKHVTLMSVISKIKKSLSKSKKLQTVSI